MRSGADSIWTRSALVSVAFVACADRPSLDTMPRDVAIDAGPALQDASDGPTAPPDVTQPDMPDPFPWQSGFRLRAKIEDGGNGAMLLDVWRDIVLGLDCTFAVATDGRMRCLPVDEDLPILTTFFADPACTKLIAIGPAPEQPYVRIVDQRCGRSDDDPKPIRVVRWGGVVSVDTPYIMRSGVCSPITNGPDFVWNAIGDADPVQFVAAAERFYVAPAGGIARILAADDGSRENARLIDPSTGRACEVVSDHILGGPSSCVPLPFAAAPILRFFDGEGCGQPLAFAEDGCDHAFAGLMLRRVDCKLGVDVVTLGASFPTASASMFRQFGDGVCRPDMLFTPMTAYEARAPFPGNMFPSTASRSFGSGRLQAHMHATWDGVAVRNAKLMPLRYQLDPDSATPVLQPAPFEFYDTILQTQCRVDAVADGTLRCIPRSTMPKLGEYFEDDACTTPAHLGTNDPGCLATGFVSVPGVLEVGLTAPPPSEIRKIGSVLQKPMHMYAPYPIDPSMPPRGTCIAAPSDTGRVFYALGPPLAVSDFALVTERTE
jgi:hypothetical protein